MELDWEEFEFRPEERNRDRIHVSINRRGNILLNSKACEALGGPDFVVLLYNQRYSTMGIKRAPDSRRNVFRLKSKYSRSKETKSRVIYAANFCRHFQIDPAETLAFTDAKVDKEGVLVLNFRETAPVKRKR